MVSQGHGSDRGLVQCIEQLSEGREEDDRLADQAVGRRPVLQMEPFRMHSETVTISAMMLGGGPTERNSRATPLHIIIYKYEANRW
jgi:hypothetical protein